MKTFFTTHNNQKQSRQKLLWLELIIFFTCMLIAALSEAQNVTSITPSLNETDVAINKSLQVYFDQNVSIDNPNANVYLFNVDDGFSTLYQFQMQDPEVSVSSSVLTINPLGFFPGNTRIALRIDSDAITGWNGILSHAFTTENESPPTMTSLSPANGATNVSVLGDLVVTFDEPVFESNSGYIQINNSDQVSAEEIIQHNSNKITVSGNQLIISDAGDADRLRLSLDYTISIVGIIKDAANYGFEGIAQGEWDFTTEDPSPPQPTTLSPADGATKIPLTGQQFTITFDEPILPNSGVVFIRNSGGGIVDQINSIEMTFGSNSASFTHSGFLPPGDDLYITLAGFQDPEGSLLTLTDQEFWNFSTVANDPPQVVSFSPADEATGVAFDQNLVITFDRPFSPFSLINKTIGIRDRQTNAVLETMFLTDPSVTISGNTITVNPTMDLPEITNVYVTMLSVTMNDGSFFAGFSDNETWDFTTLDTDPLTVTSRTPTDNATDVGVDTDLVINFSEPVFEDLASNLIIYRKSDDQFIDAFRTTDPEVSGLGTTSFTVDLPNDLDPGTEYYVFISNSYLQDNEGVNFAGYADSEGWNFTTAGTPPDITPPSLVSFSPSDEATNVPVDAALTITFDEPIMGGSQTSYTIRRRSDDLPVFTHTLPSFGQYSGNSLTLVKSNDLPESEHLYVTIPANGVRDLNGNNFAGFGDNETWDFVTETPSGVIPQLVSTVPPNGSTNAAINSSIWGVFDVPVQGIDGALNIQVFLRDYDTDAVVGTWNVNTSQIREYGKLLKLNTSGSFPPNKHYYIDIPATRIENANDGRDFPPTSSKNDWHFTTGSATDNNAPVATNLSPVQNATDVAVDADFVMTFDEIVVSEGGAIRLIKTSDMSIVETITMPDFTNVTGLGSNVITIDFTNDLEEGTEYYIEFISSLYDVAGNLESLPNWEFTTEGSTDVTPPSPVTFSPTNNAEEVAVDRWDYSITFDEPIQLTGTPGLSFQLRDASDVLITQAYGAGVTVSGNTLSVDFNYDGELNSDILEHSTFYHIEIDASYIEDLAGNDYAGFTSNTIWQFETIEAPDNDPPTVVSLAPANGAIDVAIDANLVIEFNEDIYLDNDAGTFELRRKSPDALVEAFDIFGPRVTGDNSTTVTIDPTNDLEYDTEYYFLIGGNDVIIDTGDNAFAGFSTDSDWSFSTGIEPDNIHPTITNFSPANGATGVDNDDPIVLTFSEDVQLTGFGLIQIRRASNNAILHQIDPASGQVTITGNVVTIQPTGGMLSLEEEAEIYVNWSTTPFEDLAGNDFNGLFSTTDYRFTVNNINPDMTGPVITGLSPADNATDVATDLSQLTITFDEDVQKFHPGNIIIRNGSGGILHQYFPVSTDTDVTVSNNQVTIALNETLEYSTTYYVQLASNTFEDLAGNEGPVFTDSDTWNFTTEAEPDNTAPIVTAFSPADNATNVATDPILTVTFDEPVFEGLGSGNNIIIREANGTSFEFFQITDARVTGLGTNTLSLNPNGSFSNGTSYYITFPSSIVEDAAGNSIDGWLDDQTWGFLVGTVDNTPPQVLTFSPADDALNQATDIDLVLTFDEEVKFGTSNITIKDYLTDNVVKTNGSIQVFISGAEVTLDPFTDLPNNGHYYVDIAAGSFTDLQDNPYAGTLNKDTWDFVVGILDNEAPQVVSLTPADDATDVAMNTDLTIIFDEPVFEGLGSGNHIIIREADATLFEYFLITDARVSGLGTNTLTLNPDNNFDPNKSYYVTLPSQIVEDANDNGIAGWLDANTWSFTTEAAPDNTSPTVTAFSPAHQSSDVAIDIGQLQVTFSEDIQKTNPGNIILRDFDNNIVAQYFPTFDDNDASVSGNVLTLNLPGDLTHETSYYVQFLSGTITDLAGNNFPGFIDASTWSFTTAPQPDLTAPTITNFSPTNGATGVNNSTSVVLTFDEDVQLTNYTNDFIRFRRVSNDQIIKQIDPTSPEVSISGNVVTIQPIGGILSTQEEVELYINWASTPFEDLSGNDFNGLFGSTDYRFTVDNTPADVTSPTVVSFSPAHQSADVAIDIGQLQVTFNEDIQKTNPGNIILRDFDNNIIAQYFPTFDDNDASVSGNVLTLNLPGDLTYETSYYIQFLSGTIADLAGNNFPGFNNASTWIFTTEDAPDVTPPAVVSFTPADNSTDVAVDSDFAITFDEPIQFGDGPTSAQLRRSNGAFVQDFFNNANAFVELDDNTLTFLPFEDLDNSQDYYITLGQGFVEDAAGNESVAISDITAWNFTTEPPSDTEAPMLVSLNPTDNATDIARDADLVITFNEPIQGVFTGSGFVRVKKVSNDAQVLGGRPAHETDQFTISGNTMTIHLAEPTNGLIEYSTEYYVSIPNNAIEDLSGNRFDGFEDNMTWSFTTEADPSDVTAPSIVSLTPADNSTDVDPNTNLEIVFDEDVFLSNSSFLVRYYDNNVSQYTIPYNSEDVTVNGNTITIELPGSLFGETHYWIQINAYTITDGAGNGFPGILMANRDDWDFITIGKLDQTITFETIPNKTFSDAPFSLTASASSGLPVSFDVVNGPVSIDGNEVTILGTGSVSIRARQEGNGEYNAATAEIRSFNIAKADQSITFDAIPDRAFGDSDFDLSVGASSGLAVELSIVSGPISLTGNTVTINGVGTAVIAANQTGDDNYNAANEVQQTFEISKADQVITVELIEDMLVSAAPFEVSASVNTNLELEYEITGPASISGTTITLDGTPGTVTVSVSQPGNENYNEAFASVSFSVSEKSDQTISFEEVSDKTFGDADFDLNAAASSGLNVEFSVVSGPATITGSTVTITGAGTAIVAANQPGDDSFNAAVEVQRSFEIAKADQEISIDPIGNKLTTDAPFEVIASVNSDLELTYEVSGPGTINGTTITLDGTVGSITVTVSQAGNDNFNPASTSVSFEVAEELALSLEDEHLIQFYPNPAQSFLTIESEDEVEITLTTFDGKTISVAHGKHVLLDMRELSKGVYVLEIKSEKRVRKERIIKAN